MKLAARIVLAPLLRRRSSLNPLRHKGPPREIVGICNKPKRLIKIDPRADAPHRVLLHELIHLLHPQWLEGKVEREEARQWNRLTWKAKAELLQMLGTAKTEVEVNETLVEFLIPPRGRSRRVGS